MGGAINAASFIYAPVVVAAKSRKPAGLLIGDSMTEGIQDTIDPPSDKGLLARTVGPFMACSAFCNQAHQENKLIGKTSHLTDLAAYFTHAVINLGVNNI